MKYILSVLRSVLIISLLSGIVTEATGSEKPDLVKKTIEIIRNSMYSSPVPWFDEWKKEYIETIRKAVELHRDVPRYTCLLFFVEFQEKCEEPDKFVNTEAHKPYNSPGNEVSGRGTH